MFNFKSFIINCLLLKSLKDDLEKHLKDFQKSEKNGDREKYINMLIEGIRIMEKYEDLINFLKWFIDFEIADNSSLEEKENKLQQILGYKLLGDKKNEEEYEKKLEKEEIRKRTLAWKK